MRAHLLFLLVASAILASCTRPQEVRTLAGHAAPLVANLQRASQSMDGHLKMQRQDLSRSAARFGALQGDANLLVREIEEDWTDRGRKDELARMARFRARDAVIRADPLAALKPPPLSSVTVPPLKLKGLIPAASALERLQGKQGLTAADLLAFGLATSTELKKLEQEKPSSPDTGAGAP